MLYGVGPCEWKDGRMDGWMDVLALVALAVVLADDAHGIAINFTLRHIIC